MDSGIYVLRFPNGYFYIGKSENIPNRWKQHWKDFEKGTHSRRMQEAYNQFGYPRQEVFITCHSDHCDLYESIVIRYNMGPKCLNGNQPKEVPSNEVEVLVNSGEYAGLSTAEHIQLIKAKEQQAQEAIAKQDLLQLRVRDLETQGILTPDDIKAKVQELEDDAEDLEIEALYYRDKLKTAKEELTRLSKLSWFDRLFSYKVNQVV